MTTKATAAFIAAHEAITALISTLLDEALGWQPDAQPETTTLRQRVLQTAADHLREHQAQLAETLVRWRAWVTALLGPGEG